VRSITKYMDGWDIAQEVRIERKVHKGSFLLLEGETDYKRMLKFLDEQACSVAICFGRSNLEEAMELLEDEGFPGVVGLADADFDRCGGGVPTALDNVIYSEFHDFDVDWMTDDVVDQYLTEFADKQKCVSIGGTSQIIDLIMIKLEPLSVLRPLNHQGAIKMKLSEVDISASYNGSNIDIPMLVSSISRGANAEPAARSALENRIIAEMGAGKNWKQFTNGHDMCGMLGLMLRNEIGSRRDSNTYDREVASHIRLTYSAVEFCKSHLSRELGQWQANNQPYIVIAINCNAVRNMAVN